MTSMYGATCVCLPPDAGLFEPRDVVRAVGGGDVRPRVPVPGRGSDGTRVLLC